MNGYFLTYRLFAAFIAFLIFAGAALPTGVFQKHVMKEHCEMKTPQQTTHTEKDCDFGITCSCDIEQAPIKSAAQSLQKVTVRVLAVVKVLSKVHIHTSEFDNYAISISDAYSPPPIFLANESFLI